MTTITPEHDSGFCHSASENRRMVIERLKELAQELDNCEIETKQQGGIQGGGCGSPCYYPCGYPDCPPCNEPGKFGGQKYPVTNGNRGQINTGPTKVPNEGCSRYGRGDAEEINFIKIPQAQAPVFSDCSKDSDPSLPSFAGHVFENKFVKPDPSKIPLITYPMYPEHHYRPRTPPKRTDLNQRSNSRELLNGTLLSGCDCVKRNGLQDQCKRVECRGRPECLIKPEPQCIPAKVFKGEHEEVKAYREAEKANKAVQKNVLPVCCKCPPGCSEKRKQKEKQEEKALLDRIQKLCEKQCMNEQQNLKQQKQTNKKQSNHQLHSPKTEILFCCYPAPKCEKKLKGQYSRNLGIQEIDPLRGPLMNR